MHSPAYALLWPVLGGGFFLTAIVCLVCKRWVFGIGLSVPAILLLGSWQYDRTHEQVSKLHVALLDKKLVKEDREHPENSLFHVSVTALEMGNWHGNLRATDIHLTAGPGTIVIVEIGKRPLTGSYLKSVASLNYGKPPPKYTYVPPPEGQEFKYVFLQPVPSGVELIHVISEHDDVSAKLALAFRTDRATVDRLRPPGLEPIPFEVFGLKKSAKKEISWWRPATENTEIWGHNSTDGKNYIRSKKDFFDTERAVMTWDSDGLVQYFWFGRGLRDD